MEFVDDYPPPFLFNAIKHHAGFIKDFIAKVRESADKEAMLENALLKMGSSVIDFYYGSLYPPEIIADIEKRLKSMGSFEPVAYGLLLEKSHGAKRYHNIDISDGSTWILLPGNNHEHYLHIHPARGSAHTIRVRAMALKTAVCLRIFYNELPPPDAMVDTVNEVRRRYLNESPVKNDANLMGIMRVVRYL